MKSGGERLGLPFHGQNGLFKTCQGENNAEKRFDFKRLRWSDPM
jgi:hypothetical protein